MQINNTTSTSFGARIRVRDCDIDHVMSAIDKCDMSGLKRIYKAVKSGETGIGSKDIVYIKKKGNRHGELGFLTAKIDDNKYSNDVITTFSGWSLPHYFEKIQRISKQKYFNDWKNISNKFDELNTQITYAADRMVFGSLGKGSERRRNFIMDAIYSMLSKK